ncbi:MAG: Wzy polymerase domain-containing protein, partial [Nitrospiraceae bacterium]|nr:Wzy polymerase domain-containing protein [Nitrospiraceae bacterium]
MWLLVLMFCAAASFSSLYLSSALLTPYEFLFLSLLVLFISIAFFRQASAGHLNIPLLLLPIIIFIILRIAPVFFSPVLNLHSALAKTAGLLVGALFFLSLYQAGFGEDERRRILLIVFVSGVIQSLIGIGQFFFPGIDVSPLLMKFKGIPYGSFQQLNLMGSWLATCIVISLYLTLHGWRDGFGRKLRALFMALTVLPCFVLPLTGSRTGLLGLLAGIALISFSSRDLLRQKARLMQVWFVLLILSFSLGVASSYLLKGESILISKTAGTSIHDMAGRAVLYKVSIEMFKDAPLGHGIGDFSSLYPVYETRLFKDNLNDSTRMYGSLHPHNELLYQLAESGVIGIAGLVFVSGFFVFYLLRSGIKEAGIFLGLMLPLIIHSMLEYPFYQSLPHYALFIILLYLPLAGLQNSWSFESSKTLKTGLRILITAAAAVSVILIAHTLNDYSKMIRHANQKAGAGVVNLSLLESGLRNPYLAKEAVRLRMSALLDYGARNSNKQALEAVEHWSSAEAGLS